MRHLFESRHLLCHLRYSQLSSVNVWQGEGKELGVSMLHFEQKSGNMKIKNVKRKKQVRTWFRRTSKIVSFS